MTTNINLLLRTDEESLKRRKRIKLFNFIATSVLVGVGLISLSLFLLTRAIDIPSINKEQENVLGKISGYQARQLKLFVLNNRVENIDKILKTRKDFSKVTSGLLAKVPSQLVIEDFEVDNKTVVIAGESRSLFVIGELINNLTDMVLKKDIIKSLTLNSLVLNVDKNVYQISIKSDL